MRPSSRQRTEARRLKEAALNDAMLIPKTQRLKDDRWRAGARYRSCDACGGNSGVTLAHFNIAGTFGIARKADDSQGAFLCQDCPREADTTPDRCGWWGRNVLPTLLRWRYEAETGV